MNKRLHAQVKPVARPSFLPAQSNRLHRKSACGASTARHDFTRVPIYPAAARDGLFIDGPDQGAKTPPPKDTKKTSTAKCPTDIKVARIEQINIPEFFKHEKRTGIGAIAYMEVSDAGGNDWAGTSVKETVKRISNGCGNRARDVCSNKSGEDADFKVGVETKILDIATMPALKNTFYDLHAFTRVDASILDELGKDTCEIQCSQTYQCGGKQLGPEFVITYSAKKDKVANFYDVTRITVNVAPKAATP